MNEVLFRILTSKWFQDGAKELVLMLLNWLKDQTDNTLDDKAVKEIEECLR